MSSDWSCYVPDAPEDQSNHGLSLGSHADHIFGDSSSDKTACAKVHAGQQPDLQRISMFPITLRCITLQNIHLLNATLSLSVCPWPLCGVQGHPPPPPPPSPRLWVWERKWMKEWEWKKKRVKDKLLTLNTSSSSRIRSSCREWLLGRTITFCIVPLSAGRKQTRHVTRFNRTHTDTHLDNREVCHQWN